MDSRVSRTPIIALTAHAMKGDRQHCLEAGMDDYLSKPCSKVQIFGMLKRWLPADLFSESPRQVTDNKHAKQRMTSKEISSPVDRNLAVTKKHTSTFNKYILVVDDNETNREVVSAVLELFGCTIDSATNGSEAIEKVTANNYDLVFMDCRMPVMDGFQTTVSIRRMEKCKELEGRLAIFAIRGCKPEPSKIPSTGKPNTCRKTIKFDHF